MVRGRGLAAAYVSPRAGVNAGPVSPGPGLRCRGSDGSRGGGGSAAAPRFDGREWPAHAATGPSLRVGQPACRTSSATPEAARLVVRFERVPRVERRSRRRPTLARVPCCPIPTCWTSSSANRSSASFADRLEGEQAGLALAQALDPAEYLERVALCFAVHSPGGLAATEGCDAVPGVDDDREQEALLRSRRRDRGPGHVGQQVAALVVAIDLLRGGRRVVHPRESLARGAQRKPGCEPAHRLSVFDRLEHVVACRSHRITSISVWEPFCVPDAGLFRTASAP